MVKFNKNLGFLNDTYAFCLRVISKFKLLKTIPVVGWPAGWLHADYNATVWPKLII